MSFLHGLLRWATGIPGVRQSAFLGIIAISFMFPGTGAEAAGGYTTAQAASGAAVYARSCSQCHGGKLEGESGPPLLGPTLKSAYGGGTAEPLYDFISRQMPQDAPGTLSQTQYLDVTAYLLSRNGFPSGAVPLSIGSLDHVNDGEL
jgi:mono/diheme cytochrome c family protein